ncbi:MAG: rbsB 2 [Phycisphaerales bacterium]|jgi:ribose transport system substrate-binding protein|nr:rbsB 2 [Phycisphaerales bacterium]MDB5304858.1 rbsB 2 [Phycisphaerales bacterium]
MTNRFLYLGLALALAAGCKDKPADSSSSAAASNSSAKPVIAVIPKGTTHSFWKSVEAGARQAAKEFDVEINWKGPLKESDRAQQIAIVEQFVSDNVSAIVLAPLDDSALGKPVREAGAKHIPVIIFDSALKGTPGTDFASFIATDNRAGGALGGKALVKLLGDSKKVVLLRYSEGSASTNEREAGFLDVMHQTPGVQMLVENRYGGATSAESQKAAMEMLDKLQEADAIFCPNESSTAGMLAAMRIAGLAHKAKFVGFDSSPPLIKALREGEVDALVVQNPTKMGYEAVKAAAAVIKHQPVEQHIDTGVRLITKADLDDPEVKKLVGI